MNPDVNWEISNSRTFYNETGLPKAPSGKNVAIVGQTDAAYIVGLFQEFEVPRIEHCTYIEFEVEFRYFFRDYNLEFTQGPLVYPFEPEVHVFRADILDEDNYVLKNIYTTKRGQRPETNKYKKFEGRFFYNQGRKATRIEELRLRFGVRTTFPLRLVVGIDDVKVTAECYRN